MDIRLDLSALNRLDDVARNAPQAVEGALDRTAQVVLNAKVRQVRKTYARAIPKRKNGTPMWKRSGDWLEGQSIESKPGERTITTTGNAEKYESRLANLPTGAGGVNRTNKAAENAARIVEPQVARVFESELKNRLGL